MMVDTWVALEERGRKGTKTAGLASQQSSKKGVANEWRRDALAQYEEKAVVCVSVCL